MTIKQLAAHGHSSRKIAPLLGVCESTVRYHLERQAEGVVDGRSQQPRVAARWPRICPFLGFAFSPPSEAGSRSA